MNVYTDQRAFERTRYTATIEFSLFNKKHFYEAQTLNHCDQGMCFRSEVSLKPPATVVIRVKNFRPYGDCNGDYRGLRSLTLAEAKWCNEIVNDTDHFYEIGVKYCQPAY